MKHLLSKVILAIFAMACMSACHDDTKLMTKRESMTWIESYTRSKIEFSDSICINFREKAAMQIDSLVDVGRCLQFSPRIKGRAYLSPDHKTLWYVPTKRLKMGKKYECRVNMSKLMGVDSLKDFSFWFNVRECAMGIGRCEAVIDPSTPYRVELKGSLHFNCSHYQMQKSIKRLQFSVDGRKMESVDVVPTKECVCDFVIKDTIKRSWMDKNVKLVVEEPKLHISCTSQVLILGTQKFNLRSAIVADGSQDIILHFTHCLDRGQDLEGLITIDELENVKLRQARNGYEVRVSVAAHSLPSVTVRIAPELRAECGKLFEGDQTRKVVYPDRNAPAVKILLDGNILPDETNLTLPFSAVNLIAVDVKVTKIYADNILSFLQDNDMNGRRDLCRYGQKVYQRTVRLDSDKSLDLHRWQNFSINLKGLFRQEKGAIYRVELTFCEEYSIYGYEGDIHQKVINAMQERYFSEEEEDAYVEEEDDDYYYWGYRSNDPTKPEYYRDPSHFARYNVAASNLGLIAKSNNNGEWWATVSDICTTRPLPNVCVIAYNYCLKEIARTVTDENGFARLKVKETPFVITASQGKTITYLKVGEGYENSLSRFDVNGKTSSNGVRTFVYGERGVWRPGDEVHLTMLVSDREHRLPTHHPATMEVFTPSGRFFVRKTLEKSVDGFYAFSFATRDDSPTGQWTATFRIGGVTQNYTFPIETITPNRLKVNISTADNRLQAEQSNSIDVESHWLMGAPASGLTASAEAVLYRHNSAFKGFEDYNFIDPLSEFKQSRQSLGEVTLDGEGRGVIEVRPQEAENMPGMLKASLIVQVAEPNGGVSVQTQAVEFSPYDAYVGIKLGDGRFDTDKDIKLPVVCVNPDGVACEDATISYKIYRLSWHWWWNSSASSLNKYVNGKSVQIYDSGELSANNMAVPLRISKKDWGKYLVLVENDGGHRAGGVIYVNDPAYNDFPTMDDPEAISMLSFKLDKKSYQVGERALLYLPPANGGRALVSIENGSRVLRREWVYLSKKETVHSIAITKDMSPNFYVHVTQLQPYRNADNDLPIRMYGVQSASVFDPESRITPKIIAPQQVRPQQELYVSVRESSGRPMTYTLALVDEGLLDITGFRTPDPWSAMNAREALGISTWDIYDNVAGSISGAFSSVLSIGGDEYVSALSQKEKRHNAVVKFFGPVTIAAGETRRHKIELPQYVGSLRVMVVAAHEGCAYGSAQQTIKVNAPLMIIPALPRQLSCGDKVSLPVNVFATESVGNTSVMVSATGPVSIEGRRERCVTFDGVGEQIAKFSLLCDSIREGKAHITITARSAKYQSSETIAIDVRNPQIPHCEVVREAIAAGEERTMQWEQADKVQLETTTFPSINFANCFDYIASYEHLCSEQLSSMAFFLLYARNMLDESLQADAEERLKEILWQLRMRQTADGGFSYWSSEKADEWVTSMAGQVMTEAQRQGFEVPQQILDSWLRYQNTMVRKYNHETKNPSDLMQAYRLYTLALADRPNYGAMNRLRENKSISREACVCLASTYALLDKEDVAGMLLYRDCSNVKGDKVGTFASHLRDEAMALEAEILAHRLDKALPIAQSVAASFSGGFYSTQELAFVSLAMSRMSEVSESTTGDVIVSQMGCTPTTIKQHRSQHNMNLKPSANKVTIKNTTQGTIFATLKTSFKPEGTFLAPAYARGAKIAVKYTDLEGTPINETSLRQGAVGYVTIRVSVAETSDSMALTFQIPSCWEIWNDRLIQSGCDPQSCRHADIRDDRVSWYVSMQKNRTYEFKLRFRASYEGKTMLMPVVVEDMYNANCRANTEAKKIEVI